MTREWRPLNEIIEKVFFYENNFVRMDIVIKLIAMETLRQQNLIDELYWKMQYKKLDIWRERNNESIINYQKILVQINRILYVVNEIKLKTYSKDNIVIGNNGMLRDGSHRLAAYMDNNIKCIPIEIVDTPGYFELWEDEGSLREWFTPSEQAYIEMKRDSMIMQYKEGRWN